jgi:hypothetical protein
MQTFLFYIHMLEQDLFLVLLINEVAGSVNGFYINPP